MKILDVVCGGSNIVGVTVTCSNNVAASKVSVPNATSATVNWTAGDVDSPTATVSVGYVVDSGNTNIELANVTILAENLPLGAGSHNELLTEIGSGAYRMVVLVDDDQNGVVFAVSDVVITVDDKRAPA